MEIRGREVGFISEKGLELSMKRIDYDAGNSKEIFLSIEDSKQDIAGYLRLRHIKDDSFLDETKNTGMIRELRVVGNIVPIGTHENSNYQHKGLGKSLVQEAERITREEFNESKILVISGVGVREYFRKLGYERDSYYMGKKIA